MTANPFFPDIRRSLRFPQDLLRIVYWAYFRPFTLERYIQQFDPAWRLGTSLLTLWRKGKTHPPLRQLVWLTLFHAVITPWLAFPVAYGLQALGVPVDWQGVLVGVLWGVLWDVLVGVLWGVLVGVLVGVLWGVLEGVLVGVVLWGVLVGVLVGVVAGMWVLGGVLWGVLGLGDVLEGVVVLGVVVGGVWVLWGVLWGVLEGVVVDAAFWVGVSVGSVFGALRLYEYPLWLLVAWLGGRFDVRGRRLRFSPPFWHEVIVLPLPGVKHHVLALAHTERQAGLAAVAYLGAYRYGWARKVARSVPTELLIEDMAAANDLRAIAALGSQLGWLPPESRAQWKSLRASLERVAAAVQAGLQSSTAYNRALRYQEALEALQGWQTGLMGDPLAPKLLPILQNWQALVQDALTAARKAEWLPNPYNPGSPLRTGSPVFTGREPLFKALEAELANYAEQRPALLLFGVRRMGKSSTLNQFPVHLGRDIVPVHVDVQSLSTLSDAGDFLQALMRRAVKRAYQSRAVELPEPTLAGDPFAAFLKWLDAADAVAEREGVRFLLAVDEYEKLEDAIQKGRLDERVLDLLRHILQHRTRWVVLLSGVLTFDLLPVRWSRNLINPRTLLVEPLTPDEMRQLLAFPELVAKGMRYAPEAEARLLAETGGHPNWLQAALREVVRRLNRERRLEVTPEDAEQALARVSREVPGDFDYLWREVPWNFRAAEGEITAYQQVMVWVAAEPGITVAELRRRLPEFDRLARLTLHFYKERGLMQREGGGYRWKIPLLSRWLQRRAAEEGLLPE